MDAIFINMKLLNLFLLLFILQSNLIYAIFYFLFSQKVYIKDVWHDPKYASAIICLCNDSEIRTVLQNIVNVSLECCQIDKMVA